MTYPRADFSESSARNVKALSVVQSDWPVDDLFWGCHADTSHSLALRGLWLENAKRNVMASAKVRRWAFLFRNEQSCVECWCPIGLFMISSYTAENILKAITLLFITHNSWILIWGLWEPVMAIVQTKSVPPWPDILWTEMGSKPK